MYVLNVNKGSNLTERVTNSVEGETVVVIVIEAKASVWEVAGGFDYDDDDNDSNNNGVKDIKYVMITWQKHQRGSGQRKLTLS